jgi:hypothetical protein
MLGTGTYPDAVRGGCDHHSVVGTKPYRGQIKPKVSGGGLLRQPFPQPVVCGNSPYSSDIRQATLLRRLDTLFDQHVNNSLLEARREIP